LYLEGQGEEAVILYFGDRNRIVEINVDQIVPNPAQPRRNFDKAELENLAQSILANGLLQPITVRKNASGLYEIIAGERRLRACKMVGMTSVPCIISECTPSESAVMAMTENLQRQNLGVFEEAEGIRKLIETWGVTQEEAACRLGKSQSAVANKLRLLKLTEHERQRITEAGLTERHARALVRIEDPEMRKKALNVIIERNYNVRQTDDYVMKLLSGKDAAKQHKTFVVKDVRIFLNTISHAVKTMKESGIPAQTLQSETDEYIECIVRIPKTCAHAGGRKPA
jgi:ParB family transcriptional regulator, chromosome partitioning protein